MRSTQSRVKVSQNKRGLGGGLSCEIGVYSEEDGSMLQFESDLDKTLALKSDNQKKFYLNA